jgi:hypothetical protein
MACPPETDAPSIDIVEGLQVTNRLTPVLNLAPRVDVVARFTTAGAIISMIVQQYDEARFREGASKRFDAVESG